MSGVDKQIALKDLTEVERRMESIRSSYSEHQSWNEIDRMLFKDLKDRKHDLKAKLGFSSQATNQQRKDA
jgi:predicted RNA-binding protein with EMAP domain